MSTTDHPLEHVPASGSGTIYSRTFWLAYFANLSIVTANALTFRFAEFVNFLGGTEQLAGMLISAGIAGALIAREAGARVGGLHGGREGKQLILAAAPGLYEELAAALRRAGLEA